MSLEKENPSLNTLRKEMAALDSQIESATLLRQVLEEEKKPIYSIYKWEAPERVFEQKDKKWYLIVSSVSFFFIVLSLLTGNYGLVIAIISLIILLYALNSVPPHKLNHELTNKGVSISSILYPWKKINLFWISNRGGHLFLNIIIDTKPNTQDQIISYLGDADVKKIVSYMNQFVDYVSEIDSSNNYISRKLFGTTEPLSHFIEN